MDLFSLAAAVVVALGLLGADTVLHANNLMVEVVAPPRSDKVAIDQDTLEQSFEGQLQAVAAVSSLVDPPEIRASRKQGLGMALAEAARVKAVAYALQTEMGYEPDQLRLALFLQNGTVHGLITGRSRAYGGFERVLTPRDKESLPDFVRRSALWGASHLAPYTTVLYLLQTHNSDEDLAEALAVIQREEAKLPPTPVNRQRSMFENVRGILLLFQNKAKDAEAAFTAAVAADRANPVGVLNLAFDDVQEDNYASAAALMEQLIREAPPANPVLLGTAYMTWAAAEMGLHNAARADALLAKALQVYPTSSTGYDLWADAKELLGDAEGAKAMRHKALEATADSFENYAEVAALYFHLTWQNDQPMMRNKFASMPTSTLR